MNTPTREELRERYREMADDELLVVAAESTSLTPDAAVILKDEVARRGLAEKEVAETPAAVDELKAEDDRVRQMVLGRRFGLWDMLLRFLAWLACVVWYVVSFRVAQVAFRSPDARTEFIHWSIGVYLAFYCVFELTYWRRRRQQKPGLHGQVSS